MSDERKEKIAGVFSQFLDSLEMHKTTVRGDYFVVGTVEHFLLFFSLSLSKIAITDEKIAQLRDERIAGPCISIL